MPGNIGPPSRSRDIRFPRSSSFTRRELRRCAVKAPWRNSPRVRAELMVGNLQRKQPYADYTAASVAVLSNEASGRKDTLLRYGTLWPGARKPGLRSVDAGSLPQGTPRYRGNLPHCVGFPLWIFSVSPVPSVVRLSVSWRETRPGN